VWWSTNAEKCRLARGVGRVGKSSNLVKGGGCSVMDRAPRTARTRRVTGSKSMNGEAVCI
jgi:hypothetical protein